MRSRKKWSTSASSAAVDRLTPTCCTVLTKTQIGKFLPFKNGSTCLQLRVGKNWADEPFVSSAPYPRIAFMKFRTNMVIVAATVLLGALPALGRPGHFEHIRAALISKAALCTSCHVAADSGDLNAYGQQLHDLDSETPLADRIAELEGEPTRATAAGTRPELNGQTDVDADGVANWVEILAKTNPSDGDDTPKEEAVDRIYNVVSCKVCHEAMNLPDKRGLAANPHNEFGGLLFKTFKLEKGEKRPKGADEVHQSAARTPILTRLAKVRKKKPKGSDASFWHQLRLLHAPGDSQDVPTSEELESFQADAKAQRKKATRDPNRGLSTKAHKLDGFLKEAKKLD